MIRTLNINESPIIGAFSTCTEDVALVPLGTRVDICDTLGSLLGVRVFPTLVSGSIVVGALCRGNSSGLLVAGHSTFKGADDIGLPVHYVPSKLNAIGNIVLANDTAALVHPEMTDRAVDAVAEALKVDVRRGTIGGIRTVGMAGVATNRGLLLHPRVSTEELGLIEDLFDLPVDLGTSNFGTQMVGSGVLANTKGYVAGTQTTGHELGRIEDALGF